MPLSPPRDLPEGCVLTPPTSPTLRAPPREMFSPRYAPISCWFCVHANERERPNVKGMLAIIAGAGEWIGARLQSHFTNEEVREGMT
jgi:hypothetical protein